jgi:iron complex transport system ATP-binding protein
MEMIRLENISFSYNHQLVLRDIATDFPRQSFTAVLGPNGSGKTTLIRLLNGILDPAGGKILLKGRMLQEYSTRELARTIAYVPQWQPNIFPATVFDTVLLGRKPYIRWFPGHEDKQITARILRQLHLEDIALKDINHLSGGQRQRVFIARALAQEPEIMLLDEPTANLDLQHQYEVMELLQTLIGNGLTVIMAIHDLNLALTFCSRFLLLNNGIIVANGGKEIFREDLIESVYQVKVRKIHDQGKTFLLPIHAQKNSHAD